MLGQTKLASFTRCITPSGSTSRLLHTTRSVSTPAIASLSPNLSKAYPFSSTARVVPSVPPPPAKRTDSIMRTLNAHLTSFHPSAPTYLSLFSRNDKNRILPGSVITVTSYSSLPTPESPDPPCTTFSGVLMAMRRRHAGRDTSFRLRNLVGRTGVEVAFKLFSPMVKSINVVQRATNSGPAVMNGAGLEVQRKKPALKAARRAKLYFVRDQPSKLVAVGGIVKQAREKELLAEKKRR